MPELGKKICSVETADLIEVWKVLEALTVSLDRMGYYWLKEGEEAAQQELHKYLNPKMFRRISKARSTIDAMLLACDPSNYEYLERLAQNEDDIGYWQGPLNEES
jgi:hypothetical protein